MESVQIRTDTDPLTLVSQFSHACTPLSCECKLVQACLARMQVMVRLDCHCGSRGGGSGSCCWIVSAAHGGLQEKDPLVRIGFVTVWGTKSKLASSPVGQGSG